jgi:hypothetical protein
MQTQFSRNFRWAPFILGLILISTPVISATISRIKVWTDGEILFSSDINAEFNNILNLVNGNIDDDNISATANLGPEKIDAVIAGDGIARNGSTGVLSVNDDDVSLTVVGDVLQIKALGVDTAELAADAVTSAKILDGTILTGDIAAGAIENANLALASVALGNMTTGSVNSNVIVDGSIAAADIGAGEVSQSKLGASNFQISSSSGSYLSTATSYTNVTNLSFSFVSDGTRPIIISLVPDNTAGDSYINVTETGVTTAPRMDIRILVAGNEAGYFALFQTDSLSSAAATTQVVGMPCSAVQGFYVPGAGASTVTIQAKTTTSAMTAGVVNCKLLVRQL